MRGEEKGINKASKAAHLAEGVFWWWWWWERGGVGAAGKPVQSYQSRDSHHHTQKAIQDYRLQ